MALQFQLIDAKNDLGIKGVSTHCNTTAAFVATLNQVIRQLMKRGNWFGTEVPMKLCVYGCHIVLPRHVGAITGVKTCNGQANLKNNWFEIVGSPACGFGCDWQSNATFVEDGAVPTFSPVSGTDGKQIAYHVTKNADIGKTIKIFGTKYGGQPLMEKNDDGEWEEGITITATSAGGAVLPAMTTELVTKITHVVREATSGMTYLYEYGADGNGDTKLNMIGSYEPNETNPMYRRYRIKNYSTIPGCEDDYGRTRKCIEAMVSLQFVPLVNDWDFLIIDDFDALRYGIVAAQRDESGEDDKAEKSWLKAIRELNFNDRKNTPGRNLPVSVNVMGSNRQIVNPI